MYVATRIICMELALLWANNASSNFQILTARDVYSEENYNLDSIFISKKFKTILDEVI